VYDHTGAEVASEINYGGAFSGDFPDKVVQIMADQIEANSNVGEGGGPVASAYAVQAIVEYIRKDIQGGTP